MDFGLIPPEINSTRMYAGPGAGPMLAAATAWAALAADLELAADSWQSVLAELATGWSGPSATAMTAAAMPYITWMHGAAALAEQTAIQVHAAVAAFETAFAMTVPPPVVAANRSQLLALIATNFFGQNTPAIAATEAAYAVMWAQDATAMYGYAGAAAGATALTPFTPPPQTTRPAGSEDEPAGAAPMAASPPAAELPGNAVIEIGLIPLHLGLDLFGAVVIDGLGVVAIDLPGAVGSMLVKEIAAVGSIPYVLAGISAPGMTPVAAGLGQAIPLSGLSVPNSWTAAAGAGRPVTSPAVVVRADPSASPDTFSMGPAALTTGLLRALAGLAGVQPGSAAGSTRRLSSARVPRTQEADIATELRELMDLHGSGVLTDDEFAKEKDRLFAD